jgi:hypothetical protein
MSDVSFYETSAQVIPLLLLAAVVETRFVDHLRPFEPPTRRTAVSDAILLPLAGVVIFAGEVAALHASMAGTGSTFQKRLVAIALLLGLWGLLTPILNQIIAATTKTLDEQFRDGKPGIARVARVARVAGGQACG